jgi:ABC-type glutathione transport system ATPase component
MSPSVRLTENSMRRSLKIRNLTVKFPAARAAAHTAVDNVSFDLDEAEVVGLMGESGCGKTTLSLAMLGLLTREQAEVSGSVMFGGQELLGLDERSLARVRGAKISMVPQEHGIALSPMIQVGDQIAEVLHAHKKWSWPECRAEAEGWLSKVGLLPTNRIYASYPHQLSGGQLQRVVLAQALACEPEIVIADEPTASLDALTQVSFIGLLRELKSQMGISVLLISHSAQVQAALADRVLLMKEGRIVEEGYFNKITRQSTETGTPGEFGSDSGKPNDAGAQLESAVEEPFSR